MPDIVQQIYNKMMSKPNLLVVDDESDSVDALERLFRKKFKVFKATSGPDALEMVQSNPFAIIISDQRMPEMTGVEFLQKSIEYRPEAIRILLTGYTDVESVISSINSGEIYKYTTKPWDPVDLSNTVDKAYEKYYLRQELKEKNESLKLALQELKTLDASKSQFMILINHELKTPLTVLSSFLELLQETTLDEEQMLYLSKIEKSTNQFKYISERVLSLVSAQTDQKKLKIEGVVLSKIAEKILEQNSNNISEKNLSFEINLDNKKVKGNSQKIETILSELIVNAINFSKNESSIKIHSKIDNSGYTLIIENPATKISEDQLNKILKPFSLNEDIMNHSKGLGVGLSLAQALLQQHSSTLSLSSDKSIFQASFSLPMA